MFSFAIYSLKLRPVEFWDSTPHEISILSDYFLKQEEENQKNNIANALIIAWNTANFSNAKKLPNLSKEIEKIFKEKKIKKVDNKKRMSEEEIEEHFNNKVVK